jgi:hydrogenase maturation protease
VQAGTGRLLIGYGNELRGDDAAGPVLVREAMAWRLPEVECLVTHQLTPELADPISRCREVVFVDATTGEGPGWRAVEPQAGQKALGHACQPEELLALAQALYGRAPQGWLLGLPAVEFGFGEALSAAAQEGLEQGRKMLREKLAGG